MAHTSTTPAKLLGRHAKLIVVTSKETANVDQYVTPQDFLDAVAALHPADLSDAQVLAAIQFTDADALAKVAAAVGGTLTEQQVLDAISHVEPTGGGGSGARVAGPRGRFQF